jgi:uncharacterized SAM-binding protein YcdF (DUF218 family)
MDPRLADADVSAAARLTWSYQHVNHSLQKSDVILALGSNDPRVVDRSVELYRAGYAPLILFTGGVGVLTQGLYGGKSEAAYFADLALRMGVPEADILVEGKSTNTGENIIFSRAMLAERSVDVSRVIVVTKPWMERRAFATFLRRWEGVEVAVTSPQIAFDDYPMPNAGLGLSQSEVMGVVVGDLQRVRVYGRNGLQAPQEVPADVWAAFKTLVKAGFDSHLVRDKEGNIVGMDED